MGALASATASLGIAVDVVENGRIGGVERLLRRSGGMAVADRLERLGDHRVQLCLNVLPGRDVGGRQRAGGAADRDRRARGEIRGDVVQRRTNHG